MPIEMPAISLAAVPAAARIIEFAKKLKELSGIYSITWRQYGPRDRSAMATDKIEFRTSICPIYSVHLSTWHSMRLSYTNSRTVVSNSASVSHMRRLTHVMG